MLRAIKLTVFAGWLLGAAYGQHAFLWKEGGPGRLELLENGNPVLFYNDGPQLKAGAPEDRRRCCYIFPLYTPAGVSMLDDFPQDDLHHRGIFWAWPVVETGGKTYDQWKGLTLQQESGKKILTQTTDTQTSLQSDNNWKANGQDIVHETMRLTVFPSANGARELVVDLTWEALGAPVTLRGSTEEGKSYGGFNARFAPRTGTVLRAGGQTVAKDEDLTPHPWAELEGVYAGKRVVLRITPDETNPGVPYQWCLRNYGFVGASFPGRKPAQDSLTLQPGKPLNVKFRVRVADLP